jgi:OmpA-OmpF porin, OOP family
MNTIKFQYNMISKLFGWYKFLLFALFFLTLGLSTTMGQTGDPGYYNQAEKLFSNKDYYKAAQVYEKYLTSEKKARSSGSPFAVEKKVKGKTNLNMHEEAVYSLAECYREYNDYVNAEKYYKLATAFSDKAYPLTQFWYGISLRANQKYAEAFTSISKFLDSYTEMGPVLIQADRELESLKYIQSESSKNTKDFILEQQKNLGNTSAYALAVQQDDTVVFTGIHQDSSASKNGKIEYSNSLYQSVLVGNILSESIPVNLPKPQGEQTGLACFTPDGNKMFFTRWIKKNAQTYSAIFSTERVGNSWTTPLKLGEPVNFQGYNSTQPFVTEDGKYLLFASDRPGGSGNYDLWFSELDSNFQALNVTNMGGVINTPGDEEAPFFHHKSRTLVFSSNGRIGMGGFDIYYAKGTTDFTRWEKPKNPGIPINSTKDDIYYISTDKENIWNTGWLSSDRSNDCCLALFSVKENNSMLVTGSVIDCKTKQPIDGAELIFTDPRHGNRIIGKRHADSAGQYDMEIKNISVFNVKAEKLGYSGSQSNYAVDLEPGRDTLKTESICLTLIKENIPEVKKALQTLSQNTTVGYFDYKKSKLNASYHSNLDSLADLMKRNPGIVVEIGGYTDAIGSEAYNLRLAQERVNACISYLVKKGIRPNRLIGKAYGECCPIAPETVDGKDNPAGREKNRRVEYKLVD